MAAYAALVLLINDLDLISNHPCHSFSFDNTQISFLSQTVHFLIDLLERYDPQGCSREAAQVFESRIVSAARAARELLETHVVNQIYAGSTLRAKPRSYFFLDLQKATDNMNFVKRKAMQFEGKSGMKAEQPTHLPTTSSEPQTFRKNKMVGFGAVANQLMEMLVGEASSRLVIPIVGMGGIGKTTLAIHSYEHSHALNRFGVRRWVTISKEYSAETILSQLLFGERKCTGRNVYELGIELRKDLWGRRYLIILDDMSSMEVWEEIVMFLPDNGNKSRVIITTRSSNLASKLSSSPIMMKFMDVDESWKLFCGFAFDDEECPPELEEIGKKIVKKCQGLPLSIIVIGGHLRKSSCWEKFSNLMNPILDIEEGKKCMQIINLSYEQLPIYLKPCFLYMGKYREDEWIDVTELLRLWVAEGFIRASKEGLLSLEEVAENHLNDLIERNLVVVRERRWNGKPYHCGIHDIVRELCMKVSKKEKFGCVCEKTEDVSSIVSLDETRMIVMANFMETAPLLRSMMRDKLIEMRIQRGDDDDDMHSNAGRCHMLAGSGFQLANIGYLSHPRYAHKTGFHCQLARMSHFWNLQTLIILTFGVVITAPEEIWSMAQLRHVECFKLYLPDPIP